LPSSSSSPPPPSPSSPLSLHDALPICPAHQRPHPLPLGSEDECEAAREVDVPHRRRVHVGRVRPEVGALHIVQVAREVLHDGDRDRKSTRLNSSHQIISYAVFCLKKKK